MYRNVNLERWRVYAVHTVYTLCKCTDPNHSLDQANVQSNRTDVILLCACLSLQLHSLIYLWKWSQIWKKQVKKKKRKKPDWEKWTSDSSAWPQRNSTCILSTPLKLLQGLARLSAEPAGPTECEWPRNSLHKAMQRRSNKQGWSQVLVNANENR